MLHLKRRLLVVGLAGWIALALLSHVSTLGQDQPAKASTPKADASKTEEASEADLFVVPDGGPAELVDYLNRLQKERPDPRVDRMAFIQYLIKSATPTWEAAEKILSDKSAKRGQKVLAARAKFGALGILCQTKNEKAAEAMKTFPDELAKLGLDNLARAVKSQLLQQELGKVVRKAPDAPPLDQVLGQIKAFVAEKPDGGGLQLVYGTVFVLKTMDKTDEAVALLDSVLDQVKTLVAEKSDKGSFQLAYGAVSSLQMLDKTDQAASLCDEFAKLYAKSDAKGADDLAKTCEGIARRLRLVGHPMNVEGVLLDGKPFDWGVYKGKVVLVQFWATWCGYCVKEIPNIEKCYKDYHDRGFDVVSISADRSRAALDRFLEKKDLPWPILYKEGQRNPTEEYYGVISWPTLILVGSDGNVVSIEARGPKLVELLEKLLGPAEPKKTEDEPSKP